MDKRKVPRVYVVWRRGGGSDRSLRVATFASRVNAQRYVAALELAATVATPRYEIATVESPSSSDRTLIRD